MAMVDAFLEGTAGAPDSPGDIVLDLTRLTFIDSSGLKAVAKLAQRLTGSSSFVAHRRTCCVSSTSWASTASWAFASWADVDTRCCQGGSGNRQRHARGRHPDHRRWSGRAAGPQRADCYEQLHGRGGDNHPTFEDAFVATGSTSASGTSRHCAYMLSFPEMLGLPTIPATDIRYADPDGEGRYVAI